MTDAKQPDRSRAVPGSEPVQTPDAGASRAVVEQVITVTVRLRQRPDSRPLDEVIAEQQATPPADRRYLTREDMAQSFGASPGDIERVVTFARDAGVAVEEVDAGARTVRLRGPAGMLATAFGVRLATARVAGRTVLTHRGPVHVPAQLGAAVVGVLGFSTVPVDTGGPPPHAPLD